MESETETKKEITNWEKLVELVRADFGGGASNGRIHEVGGGPDTQGERGLLWYRHR